MWSNLLLWKLIRVELHCSLYYMSKVWWNRKNSFFGFNATSNRTTSPWTPIVEHACSTEPVLIFQKALQSNIIISKQLSQGRVAGFNPGTLYQAQDKQRSLNLQYFVFQTFTSAAGKGKAEIWNLRYPRQLQQALSRSPPSCCAKVGGCQTLFLSF